MAKSDATTKQSARYKKNKYISNKILPRKRINNKKFAFILNNYTTKRDAVYVLLQR